MSILSRISDRIDRYLQERREIAELRRQEAERQERIREYRFGMGNDFEVPSSVCSIHPCSN